MAGGRTGYFGARGGLFVLPADAGRLRLNTEKGLRRKMFEHNLCPLHLRKSRVSVKQVDSQEVSLLVIISNPYQA